MKKELWKDVPGLEGLQVSNTGEVRRWGGETWIPVPKQTQTVGYEQVWIRGRGLLVHRLVALAFLQVPQDPGRFHVHHRNGFRKDNRPENLEWLTPKEHRLYHRAGSEGELPVLV